MCSVVSAKLFNNLNTRLLQTAPISERRLVQNYSSSFSGDMSAQELSLINLPTTKIRKSSMTCSTESPKIDSEMLQVLALKMNNF